MIIASQNGHEDVVNLLIKNGAEIDLETNTGKTALKIAREMGHTEIVQLLQNAGAKD